MRKISIIILFISCSIFFVSCVGPAEGKTDSILTDDITKMKDSTQDESTIKKNEIPQINEDDNKTKNTEVYNRNNRDGLIGVLMFFWDGVSATCHFVKTHKPSWWQ